MRILITGITGFVGSYLAEYCLSQNGVEVFGCVMPSQLEDALPGLDNTVLIECDLKDRASVEGLISKTKPDVIFHLAAQSIVSISWEAPESTLINNIIPELNIFEVLRQMQMDPVIVIACSCDEYGLVLEHELPIKEENPLRPLSPYGVSKICQELFAFQYHKSYGTKTVITRFFNTEGPRRGQDFVISNFAWQIARIEKGVQPPVIYVGNLEVRRDFSDVRDMVRAYWLATKKCEFGVPYNVSSDTAVPIREVLEKILSMSNVKGITVAQDEKRMRPSDVMVLQGDSSKFREATGWEPEIPLEKTLQDMLDYWRATFK